MSHRVVAIARYRHPTYRISRDNHRGMNPAAPAVPRQCPGNAPAVWPPGCGAKKRPGGEEGGGCSSSFCLYAVPRRPSLSDRPRNRRCGLFFLLLSFSHPTPFHSSPFPTQSTPSPLSLSPARTGASSAWCSTYLENGYLTKHEYLDDGLVGGVREGRGRSGGGGGEAAPVWRGGVPAGMSTGVRRFSAAAAFLRPCRPADLYLSRPLTLRGGESAGYCVAALRARRDNSCHAAPCYASRTLFHSDCAAGWTSLRASRVRHDEPNKCEG